VQVNTDKDAAAIVKEMDEFLAKKIIDHKKDPVLQ
jgi:hypothetical protein